MMIVLDCVVLQLHTRLVRDAQSAEIVLRLPSSSIVRVGEVVDMT